MKNEEKRAYVTIAEAARILGVSRAVFYYWEKRGRITMGRHPVLRRRIVFRKELDRFLKQGTF